MICTLVTAYYEIKSKFNREQYMSWARTYLSLKSPIILFTEEHMVSTIKELRGDKPIHIIILPFHELDTWKLYKDKWIAHHDMDPENVIHSPELYAVWAQKAFFVERAISINPFTTEFFFWCDIGAFRNPNIDPLILSTFPSTRYMEPNRMLFQSLVDVKSSDKVKKSDGIYGEVISNEWNEIRIVGGLWGGGMNACLQWKKVFLNTLERYFDANRFAGKDQQVMFSTILENLDIVKVVRFTNYSIDMWFFLEYLLSERNEYYLEDSTYNLIIN